MADIYFLGTGGSVATRGRDNTSFLIRAGREIVLVECPGSVIQKLKKLGFEPNRVARVMLTHVHPDHTYGLPSLVHGLMLEEGVIDLYGSEETMSFARRLLDVYGLRDRKFRTRVRFRPLRPGRRVDLGKCLAVRALEVRHHPSSLAYHFYIEEGRRELVCSGDTAVHPPLFREAGGADCLIHDSSGPHRYFERYPILSTMHTSSLDLGRFAQSAGVRCLVPCHFLGELEFSTPEIRREIRRGFKGRLIIPRDLQRITL
jgi:ribonuclease Z